MSKRTLRRAAERENRKAAYQQLRQQRAQSVPVMDTPAPEPEVNAPDSPERGRPSRPSPGLLPHRPGNIGRADRRQPRKRKTLNRPGQSRR